MRKDKEQVASEVYPPDLWRDWLVIDKDGRSLYISALGPQGETAAFPLINPGRRVLGK